MKIGMQELIVVLIVVVIIFGPTQLPKLTKMFGKSIMSFRDGLESEDVDETLAEDKPQKAQKETPEKDADISDEES